MILEKRRLTMYRATRKVYRDIIDEESGGVDDTIVVTQAKWHRSRADAYRWIAYGMLFMMCDDADGYDNDEKRCRLCAEAKAQARIDDAPHAGLSTCKWHDRGWMAERAKRIARLIRHYDEKGIAP